MTRSALSLNQATTRGHGLRETAAAAAEAGIQQLGLWIEPVNEIGIPAARQILADLQLSASSISRTGFVADKSGQELRSALEDARRAIDMAYELGRPPVTFIAGGLPDNSRIIRSAEGRVHDALEQLVPYAAEAGVRLMLEPIHPLFAAQRSIVTTTAQALRMIADLPSEQVGVLVDTYAVWWDPEILDSLGEAGDRIAGFQVSDFGLPLPLPENMNGRLMIGDGCIDFAALLGAARAAGYRGPVEVEIFNEDLWALPLETIISQTVSSFNKHIEGIRQ